MGIWCREGLNVVAVDVSIYNVEKQIELCCCLWKPDSYTSVYIFSCYRPPTNGADNLAVFFEKLTAAINKIYKIGSTIIIGGDFNLDPVRDKREYDILCGILTTYGLTNNVVNQPTRGSYQLDHAFLNYGGEHRVECKIDPNAISDHYTVLFQVDIPSSGSCGVEGLTGKRRRFTTEGTDALKCLLEGESWADVYREREITSSFQQFINILKFYFDIVFPEATVATRGTKRSWCNNEVKQSSAWLRDLFNLKNRYPQLSNYYNSAKLRHRRLVRETKRRFYQNFIENSSNPSVAAWKVVNTLTNRQNRRKNIVIDEGSGEVKDPFEVANIFNSFFKQAPVSVVQQINNNCHYDCTDKQEGKGRCNPFTLFLRPVTDDEVQLIIKHKIKGGSAAGPDGIPPFILKALWSPLSAPLAYLVNLSFECASFPDQLKLNYILPLHKKGSAQLVLNYRPIAISSCFSKVFEYSFLNILTQFLERHAILSDNQHGFRAKRSTETALFCFFDKLVRCLDAGGCPVGIFCDLSRAFDCVDHEILLSTLDGYGVRGVAGAWLKSFLSDRRQCVLLSHRIGNALTSCHSQELVVNIGVPQGSVLGPVLFLLYINRLNDFLARFPVVTTMYADDTSFLLSNNDDDILRANSCEVLSRAAAWFGENSLFLNRDKTTYIRFHSYQKQVSNLQIGTDSWRIGCVSTVQFLGMQIDETLSFRDHCGGLMTKLDSACYMLRSLRGILTIPQLLSLYHAYVESRLRYGVAFWGLSAGAADVFIRQKRILRTMAGISDSTYSCRGLFKFFRVLTLSGLFILTLSLKIYKKRESLLTGSDIHAYDTRRKQQLRCPFSRLNVTQRAPDNVGIKIFNALPLNLKSASSEFIFKRNLKQFLLENCFYSLDEFYAFCSS